MVLSLSFRNRERAANRHTVNGFRHPFPGGDRSGNRRRQAEIPVMVLPRSSRNRERAANRHTVYGFRHSVPRGDRSGIRRNVAEIPGTL